MKRIFILGILFIGIITQGHAQKSLSDYSYVIVPEQFSFLDTPDKYELNSMSLFFLNKYGFHAFLSTEVPNAKSCDGLYFDLDRINSFIVHKFSIILKDCNGVEVYRSPEGVSKIRDFKSGYQDAVRKAFLNVGDLKVQQKEIVESMQPAEAVVSSEAPVDDNPQTTVNSATTTAAIALTSTDIAVESPKIMLPQDKFSSYMFDGKSFLLRKTSDGYSLYLETISADEELQLIGKIAMQQHDQLLFTDSANTSYDASFDADQNLIINKATISEVYILVR